MPCLAAAPSLPAPSVCFLCVVWDVAAPRAAPVQVCAVEPAGGGARLISVLRGEEPAVTGDALPVFPCHATGSQPGTGALVVLPWPPRSLLGSCCVMRDTDGTVTGQCSVEIPSSWPWRGCGETQRRGPRVLF